MKAFLTGATGFVGTHVARELAAGGASLRLLVRSSSVTRNIDDVPGDRVQGDLLKPESLQQAMSGCDAVFHVAADYRLWTRDAADEQSMYRCNVDGTRGLIEAAAANGIKRLVYCSSVATMGFTGNGHPADENSPVTLNDMIGAYKRSKFLGEQEAIKAGAANAVEVIVVNPSTPVGERDIKPTPTGRIIVDFLKRKFPAYVDTGLNLVDVRDVARGHIAAWEKGRAGERYILGGENLTLKQILDRLAAITGLPAPTVKLPYAMALAAGVADTVVTGKILRREPRVTIDAVRMGRKKMFVSSAKAERELNWKAAPVDDALHRACDWFKANGYV